MVINDMKLVYVASGTKCSQCQNVYTSSSIGWIYHSAPVNGFSCSKECKDLLKESVVFLKPRVIR